MLRQLAITVLLAPLASIAAPVLQNPGTDCATVSQYPSGIVDASQCTPNGCPYTCATSSFEDEGVTYTYCNCGDVYSSICCQTFAGIDGQGGASWEASGSCSQAQGCGNDGGCTLSGSEPPEDPLIFAVCQ